jgi:hypothetical protein
LAVYMARTGKLIADAKIHREQKLRKWFKNTKLIEFPASVAVKYTDTLVENENILIDLGYKIKRSLYPSVGLV